MSLYPQFTDLQAVLCCPRSKSTLSLMTYSELLECLPEDERRRVPDGTVGAFVSESSLTAYPIVGNIADFLEQDSLALSKEGSRKRSIDSEAASIQQSVQKWYDEFGWRRNARGMYNDTALFSQTALTGCGIYELSSHLAFLDRLSSGEFLLDAASGPLAHPEYLAYSWFYKHRVCIDISSTALFEAQAKVGPKGFCCLADICHLPFRDDVFDAIVSAYTIQHIAESQQLDAIAELYRVLKPGSHLCIVTWIPHSWAHRSLFFALRAIRTILNLLSIGRVRPMLHGAQPNTLPSPPQKLYCCNRDLAWWRTAARNLSCAYSVEGLRLFATEEFEFLFGESVRSARIVRALETLFPRLAATMCVYLLVDVVKLPRYETRIPASRLRETDSIASRDPANAA